MSSEAGMIVDGGHPSQAAKPRHGGSGLSIAVPGGRTRTGGPRSGFARATLLLAAVGAAALLGYLFFVSTGGQRGAPEDPAAGDPAAGARVAAAEAGPDVAGARGAGNTNSASPESGARTRAEAPAPGSAAGPRFTPESGARPLLRRAERGGRDERYRGRGRIRGSLVVRGGGTPPESWRLVLTPSLFLAGRQHAVRRVVEIEPGTSEFAVPDLPLGAYDLRVQAAGWNSIVQPIELHTQNRDPYVTLALSRAGFVDGQVIEPEGHPLPELVVTLTPLPDQPQLADVEPRTVLTDTLGAYRFDAVLDGGYELQFGSITPPVLPVRRITFEAPSMRVPTLEAPPRPALEVTVVDAAGFPVPDALVVVDGPASQARGTTGPDGRLRIALLGAGENQVAVRHADHGSAVRVLELPDSGLVAVRLELGK